MNYENSPYFLPATYLDGILLKAVMMVLVLCLQSGCALMFPTEAGEDLAHFADKAPAVGDPAPEIEARNLDGEPVTVSDLIGKRPVVLQLGSHSCPVYRYRRFDIFKLQRDYGDRVDFVVVYTQEAHPVGSVSPYRDDEWLTFPNWITNTRVTQPANFNERLERAKWSSRELDREDQILVDEMHDHTWSSYGAAPSAAFVIDLDGRVILAQPWVEPKGIRAVLDQLLSKRE